MLTPVEPSIAEAENGVLNQYESIPLWACQYYPGEAIGAAPPPGCQERLVEGLPLQVVVKDLIDQC